MCQVPAAQSCYSGLALHTVGGSGVIHTDKFLGWHTQTHQLQYFSYAAMLKEAHPQGPADFLLQLWEGILFSLTESDSLL